MNKLVAYLRDSWEELKKVTWPTRKQTINYSIAVVALSLALAVFIAALDYGFNQGFQYIISNKATTEISDETTPGPIEGSPIQIESDGVQVETVPAE